MEQKPELSLDEARVRADQEIRSVLENKQDALLIYPTGIGKTHMVTELAQELALKFIYFSPTFKALEESKKQIKKQKEAIILYGRSHYECIKSENMAYYFKHKDINTAFCEGCKLNNKCGYYKARKQAKTKKYIYFTAASLACRGDILSYFGLDKDLVIFDEHTLRIINERIHEARPVDLLAVCGKILPILDEYFPLKQYTDNIQLIISSLNQLLLCLQESKEIPPFPEIPDLYLMFRHIEQLYPYYQFISKYRESKNVLINLFQNRYSFTCSKIPYIMIHMSTKVVIPNNTTALVLDATGNKHYYEKVINRPLKVLGNSFSVKTTANISLIANTNYSRRDFNRKLSKYHSPYNSILKIVAGHLKSIESDLRNGLRKIVFCFRQKDLTNDLLNGLKSINVEVINFKNVKDYDGVTKYPYFYYGQERGINTFQDYTDLFIVGFQFPDLKKLEPMLKHCSNTDKPLELIEQSKVPFHSKTGDKWIELNFWTSMNPDIASVIDQILYAPMLQAIGRLRFYNETQVKDTTGNQREIIKNVFILSRYYNPYLDGFVSNIYPTLSSFINEGYKDTMVLRKGSLHFRILATFQKILDDGEGINSEVLFKYIQIKGVAVSRSVIYKHWKAIKKINIENLVKRNRKYYLINQEIKLKSKVGIPLFVHVPSNGES